MNTFWLKIAAGVVGIVVVIVLIGTFTSNGSQESKPKQPEKTFYDQAREDKEKYLPEKTFYDQAREDKEKYLTEPKPQETQEQTPAAQQPAENNTEAAPAQPTQTPVEPPKPATLYFKKLSEIDDIEAQRLLNVAVPGRSIGRLPMTGYNLMVPNCREIIKKWPDSWYAYRAKQMLGDLPARYQTRYNITEKEKDLSMYYKQRPGTEPYTMEGTR